MEKVIILSGAGISAESGLKTFRDSDGLWENYKIEDVATPEGWKKNRKLVLEFYNERRKQVLKARPNEAHHALVKLEEKFDVTIVTQNIDDLHERAGSEKVLHLHGEILKSRSSFDPSLVYKIEGEELNEGEICEMGYQLRPHIVWFGEMVPILDDAARLVSQADVLIVVGTSLAVHPAAGLINFASIASEKYYVDPNGASLQGFTVIREKAVLGITKLVNHLMKDKQ